jgi:hypothetical protein
MSWRNDPIGRTELERALLEAGRSYGSSPRARARTLAALGLTGSAAAGLGGAAAATAASTVPAGLGAKATATAGSALAKVAAGVAIVGALGAIPVAYSVSRRRTDATIEVAEAARNLAAPSFAEPAEPTALAVPPIADVVPAAPPPAPARPVPSSARGGRAEPRTSPGAAPLTEELLALDTARSALAGGDAGRALALLDAYAHTYPSARLELEAEILRIDALSQSGRPDVARKRAELFVRRHPKSVLAPRARRFLDD